MDWATQKGVEALVAEDHETGAAVHLPCAQHAFPFFFTANIILWQKGWMLECMIDSCCSLQSLELGKDQFLIARNCEVVHVTL